MQLYCTDASQVYSALIPEKPWARSKRVTKGIERNHTPHWHGIARLKRKSVVISRNIEMGDLMMRSLRNAI